MPWLQINNGDGGNFETDPGAVDGSGYHSNWNIKESEPSLFAFTSSSEESFKGAKSLFSRYGVNLSAAGIPFPDPPALLKMVKELQLTAVENKFYRVRAYFRIEAPNVVNQSDKEKLTFRLIADGSLGANPQVDSFPDSSNKSILSLSEMVQGQWYEIETQFKALSNGNIFFDLEQFYNATGFNPDILEGCVFNFDAVEYLEHDKLSLNVEKTNLSYLNAGDAKVKGIFSGGSESYKIEFFEQTFNSGGNQGYSLLFQITSDSENPIFEYELENLQPGTYRVKITDNELSYVIAENITIQELESTLELVVNKSNVSASGLSDGSILLSATGDSGEYEFEITPENGTQVSESERTDLPAGVYRCKVTDINSGATDGKLVTINDPASNLTLSLTKQDVTIPGLSNGKITANAFGDTGVYAFSIVPQNGQQDQNIFTGLAAGVYDITVEDLNSEATVTEQITIVEPDELAIDITEQTNNLCFESEQGAVSLSVSGGTGPYSYLWNDGPTTLNRIGLSTGNHQIRITDSLGYSKVFTITITSPPRIVINLSKTGQEVSVSVTGGVAPYTYLWSDGSTEQQRTLAIGSYILQVTDANGCTKSTTVEITDFKFYFSKNPVWLERLTDPTAKENLSWDAVLKIEKDYNSGTFETLFTANHPAREDGSTLFEFSEILKGQLQLALPEHKGKLPYIMEGNFKRFYVESNEKYGAPPAAQTAVTTETFHILRGGLSREEFASDVFFSVFLNNPKTPFFSWEAIAKNVYPDQPEYLAYPLVNIGTSQIKIKAEAFDLEHNLLFTKQTDFINGVQPYMLINFPVGFSQLGFSSIAGNNEIAYYNVEAINQNELSISEKKYYYLNWKTQNSRKYFIYENALGVWATLVAEGNTIGSLEVEMEMLKKPVQFGYSPNQRTEQSENKVLKQTFTHSAGNMIEEESFILADFIRSENVYEFTSKRWRPVSIEMGGDWFNTFEDSTPFEFTVMYEKDKNWTPDVFRVDNRKLIVGNDDGEDNGEFTDYGFEGSYSSWNLPALNDDRITRSSSVTNLGNGAAKFSMNPFYNFKAEDGDDLFPSYGCHFIYVDVTNIVKNNQYNIFDIFVKSNGIIDTHGNAAFLYFTLARKRHDENILRVEINASSIYGDAAYYIERSSINFSENWQRIFRKYLVEDIQEGDEFYLMVQTNIQKESITNFDELEIYFDDFSVTYENL